MMSFDITNTEGIFDNYTHERFVAWRMASEEEDRIAAEVRSDSNHPLYIEAQQKANNALIHLLSTPASRLHGVLLKLKTAAMVEDSVSDAIDSSNRMIAPRAIVAAINDIEHMLFFEIGKMNQESV